EASLKNNLMRIVFERGPFNYVERGAEEREFTFSPSERSACAGKRRDKILILQLTPRRQDSKVLVSPL
ncbi:MAG: hypothetical protein AAB869_03900, partial [Patescibacteria group bacterium]